MSTPDRTYHTDAEILAAAIRELANEVRLDREFRREAGNETAHALLELADVFHRYLHPIGSLGPQRTPKRGTFNKFPKMEVKEAETE